MNLGGLQLRQRDGISCGPTVAVIAGALLDPAYGAGLREVSPHAWFEAEQGRVHRAVNRIWPRRLGMTPPGLANAISQHTPVPYRWRMIRRPIPPRRDRLAEVLQALGADRPVAMLVGRRIPRHWVLIIAADGDRLYCYEPSSGLVRAVTVGAVRRSELTGLGYPRPFAFVLPRRP